MVVGKFKQNPVVVIGMHRSGTTLTSKLLQELGLHIGEDLCRKNLESFSFMRLNDKLLHSANANWHNPSPFWKVLNDDQRIESLTAQIRNEISEGALDDYWRESRSAGAAWEGIWGWKDPRTTLTLPIWHRLFPHAKIIYIVRNGIDVAWSLVKRNEKEYDPRISTAFKRKFVQFLNHRRSENRLYYTDPNPSLTVEEAFHLWTEYLRFADLNTGKISDDKILRLRYEDLLTEPLSLLPIIADFVRVETENSKLAEIAKYINHNRRFAFARDPELRDFYRTHRKHHQMVEHGYDQLSEQDTNLRAS